ncbi:MAG: hypothetical protein DRJ42_08020 [Deltaproteobacteria bacterium]|nr:MAG: hypothetical protein DRJ42_08020 [Deltaproteobacteria bacterium]
MYRTYVYTVSVVLTGLVLWPAFRDPPVDSFPLSNYPMFSAGRPDPMLTLPHALGVHEDGERTPLSPMIASDNWEVLQSMMIINTAINGGAHTQEPFCAAIAGRVAESNDDDLADVVAVELATSTFDTVAYFDGDTAPRNRQVHRSCEVTR